MSLRRSTFSSAHLSSWRLPILLPSLLHSLICSCNFDSKLASALSIESDYHAALNSLNTCFSAASALRLPELQAFFVASTLHVRLFHWDDPATVGAASRQSSELWEPFILIGSIQAITSGSMSPHLERTRGGLCDISITSAQRRTEGIPRRKAVVEEVTLNSGALRASLADIISLTPKMEPISLK
ncbi:hypothetical protein AXF42_Ash008631 [Apostasia shenzhenica]|uniref:Uncharacterized protein n=1 Tax=Apostasia shenzhenica TaxID=1088818 RepID=A0A2I0B1Y8_9ASPA|nr:hypothetical protein AXF42_Ash008631 [Apostasia shenzhenica]